MLSYQHAYHAGNPADVLKHAIWAEILHALIQKPKQLNVYETHAGRGAYPVDAPETQKTPEYQHGLAKLQPFTQQSGAYFAAVQALNPAGTLAVIPGSPAVAAHVLRPDMDHLHLAEAHPGEVEYLQNHFYRTPHVHVHVADGHTLVPGLIRPGARNAVLMDPSYEVKSEYAKTVQTVAAILAKAPQTTLMVWYPILPSRAHQALIDGLKALQVQATWLAQVTWPSPGPGLTGTGQVVLNLPYRLEDTLPALSSSLIGTMLKKATPTHTMLVPRA